LAPTRLTHIKKATFNPLIASQPSKLSNHDLSSRGSNYVLLFSIARLSRIVPWIPSGTLVYTLRRRSHMLEKDNGTPEQDALMIHNSRSVENYGVLPMTG